MFDLGLYLPASTAHIESRGGHFQTEVVRQFRGATVIEVRRIVPVRWPGVCRRLLQRFRDWREWRAIKRGEPINWPDRLRPFVKK